jgi:hypothetical protein
MHAQASRPDKTLHNAFKEPESARIMQTRMVHTDYMDRVGRLGAWHTNEEVVRLDIAVDQRLLMNGLHAGDLSPPPKKKSQP